MFLLNNNNSYKLITSRYVPDLTKPKPVRLGYHEIIKKNDYTIIIKLMNYYDFGVRKIACPSPSVRMVHCNSRPSDLTWLKSFWFSRFGVQRKADYSTLKKTQLGKCLIFCLYLPGVVLKKKNFSSNSNHYCL